MLTATSFLYSLFKKLSTSIAGELQGPRGVGGSDARGRNVQLLHDVLGGRGQEALPAYLHLRRTARLLLGRLDHRRRAHQHPGPRGVILRLSHHLFPIKPL